MERWRAVLIALDQLVNALVGGMPDETISARAWRKQDTRRWRIAARVINAAFFDADHCRVAYELEMRRAQLPAEYRTTMLCRSS